MKPRLVKICGVWHCGIKGGFRNQWYGMGFTPLAAVKDCKNR
jgi:hypothetical protein